jgi:hypothetical protein
MAHHLPATSDALSIPHHGRRIEASNANSERAAEILYCAHQGLDPPYIARRPYLLGSIRDIPCWVGLPGSDVSTISLT